MLSQLPSSIGQLNMLQELNITWCFKFLKIATIYWPIECTSKIQIAKLLQVGGITYINWLIKYTSRT
jgi:hypothetical protein